MPRKTAARAIVSATQDGGRPAHAPTNVSPGAHPSSADLLAGVTLNPAQAAFLATDARFSFYVGGVGAGKTFAGALRALAYALDHPGSVGLIGAPTYPMLRDATQRTVFELLDGLRERPMGTDCKPWDYTYRKVENHLLLPNGSEVLFRSLDEPDRVRGLNLAWFWLDEAALCGYYAWQILKGRLRQQGFAHHTAGWATGTPHGRDGFARDFELAPRPHHALYRASTLENAAHLPEHYVADLGLSGALYDQEVLGLFTAFEGLVYPFAFDANDGADSNVRAPAEGQIFARIIGGVDWGYTNPTAAVVFGLDGDDRACQLDELYQRRAPLDAVVLPALCELTRRYGVTTWYCGPDEPEHIAALQAALLREGLPCQALPAEDAIRPGIQTVLRLLGLRGDGTRGLYVAPRCVATLAEYASYQYPQAETAALVTAHSFGPQGTDAAHAAELPVKANDHAMDACFVAGTLVETDTGLKPIEDVRPGDKVLTRKGYRPVLGAGMTQPRAEVMRVVFSDGSSLVGTPGHPVFVKGAGYISLRALRYGDTMLGAWQVQREPLSCDDLANPTAANACSTRGSSLGGTRARVGGPIGCTTLPLVSFVSRALAGYIRRFGGTHTGKSRRIATFIIGTATRSTMRWRIWSACKPPSITSTTCHCSVQRSVQSGVSGSIAFVSARAIGTALRRAVNGTQSLVASLGKSVPTSSTPASTAGCALSHVPSIGEPSGFARMHASRRTAGIRAKTWRNAYAWSVANATWRTDSRLALPVPIHVVRLSNTGDDGKPLSRQPVYNLEVHDAHEYFAQGVLVHNCRYALHTALGVQARAADVWMGLYLRRPR